MGLLLSRSDTTRSCLLEPEHLIGRNPQCALELVGEYVSAQHALIRWNTTDWELLDRGSKNGTFLEGERIAPGSCHRIKVGAAIAFGDPAEAWILRDAGKPLPMIVALDTRETLVVSGGLQLPSSDDPHYLIYCDTDGCWKLEDRDGRTTLLRNGLIFSMGSRSWRFCCSEAIKATAGVSAAARISPTARFDVSRDEDFVELHLEFPNRNVYVGARAHNYLLLTLARARLKDRESGLPETSCGWTPKTELAAGLRVAPVQIDREVFRIKQHLANLESTSAVALIERRPRTGQLRFGLSTISVVRL